MEVESVTTLVVLGVVDADVSVGVVIETLTGIEVVEVEIGIELELDVDVPVGSVFRGVPLSATASDGVLEFKKNSSK